MSRSQFIIQTSPTQGRNRPLYPVSTTEHCELRLQSDSHFPSKRRKIRYHYRIGMQYGLWQNRSTSMAWRKVGNRRKLCNREAYSSRRLSILLSAYLYSTSKALFTILTGIPSEKLKYKAISHVGVPSISLTCIARGCRHNSNFDFEAPRPSEYYGIGWIS